MPGGKSVRIVWSERDHFISLNPPTTTVGNGVSK